MTVEIYGNMHITLEVIKMFLRKIGISKNVTVISQKLFIQELQIRNQNATKHELTIQHKITILIDLMILPITLKIFKKAFM